MAYPESILNTSLLEAVSSYPLMRQHHNIYTNAEEFLTNRGFATLTVTALNPASISLPCRYHWLSECVNCVCNITLTNSSTIMLHFVSDVVYISNKLAATSVSLCCSQLGAASTQYIMPTPL